MYRSVGKGTNDDKRDYEVAFYILASDSSVLILHLPNGVIAHILSFCYEHSLLCTLMTVLQILVG